MLTRPALRRISPFVLGVANSGQALPAYGLLVIFLGIMGQGAFTVIVALSLYALLPVLRNTMVGLDGVDRSVIEAGRGMGMTKAAGRSPGSSSRSPCRSSSPACGPP